MATVNNEVPTKTAPFEQADPLKPSSSSSTTSENEEPTTAPILELSLLYSKYHHDLQIVPSTPSSIEADDKPSTKLKKKKQHPDTTDGETHRTPLYFVQHSSGTTSSKLSITLRSVSVTGPTVGVSQIHDVDDMVAKPDSDNLVATLGLGDPFATSSSESSAVIWEYLTRDDHPLHPSHSFSVSLPSNEHKTFLWKRTHGFPSYIGGRKSMRHLKLVEKDTGNVVGLFVYYGWLISWRQKGRILFWKSWGEEWERMVLLAALSLMEVARRNTSGFSYSVSAARLLLFQGS